MEGALSKWTNVVQGWQYRWFFLNDETLCYFTSREKMLRGQQRGCIRLRGAIVGIDGENGALFTITVDGKVFHIQGRDTNERNKWVRALETVIHRQSGYYRPPGEQKRNSLQLNPLTHLNARIVQADKHLQDMIREVKDLEQMLENCDASQKAKLQTLLHSANSLLETVKHAIILLQSQVTMVSFSDPSGDTASVDSVKKTEDRREVTTAICETEQVLPPISYSSSDEEEYFDAEQDEEEDSEETIAGNVRRVERSVDEPEYGDEGEDFDAICDDEQESDVGDVQQRHGSVIMHLLSQVSVGMDLTKVTLPTFILERRSLLEMYADFFAHPDDFVSSTDLPTPEERFIAVVRYYLSAFYAARKSGVAKKPYNPILGETFRCRWDVPGMARSGEVISGGPFPGSDRNQLTFLAEQVSHHPPVSGFYAEHPAKRISFNAHIWTKSSFLGLSIGVTNIGSGSVILHEHDEEYVLTFPNGYGRSIMSTPWVELGGKVNIACAKTGYTAEVEFLTKPFFGGKAHRITGNISRAGLKKPVLTVKGEWNGVVMAKSANGEEFVFFDARAKGEVRKECDRIRDQGDRESRRLWRHVTCALKRDRISIATAAKRWIEQRQRDEAKQRHADGQIWTPKHFRRNDGDGWQFVDSLASR